MGDKNKQTKPDFPFEFFPYEYKAATCHEIVIEVGINRFFQATVKDYKPKLIVDLDEALGYGEQQGSIIVVHQNPYISTTPLPVEGSFSEIQPEGVEIFHEFPYELWAYNEVISTGHLHVAPTGTYYTYIQLGNRYYQCAKPKKVWVWPAAKGGEWSLSRDRNDKPLPPYGDFGMTRIKVGSIQEPPVPIQNILGWFYTIHPTPSEELDVGFFRSLPQNEYVYLDTSYLSYYLANFLEMGKTKVEKPNPEESYMLFAHFAQKDFTILKAETLYPAESYQYSLGFWHYIDWQGIERVDSSKAFANRFYLEEFHKTEMAEIDGTRQVFDNRCKERGFHENGEIEEGVFCNCKIVTGSLDAEVRPKNLGAYVSPNRIFTSYKEKRKVEIFKIPKHWHFFGWFGTNSSKKNPLEINGKQDHVLIGILDKDKLNINISAENGGVILGITSYTCDYGDTCYAHCVPLENYEFTGWKNDLGHIISKNLTLSFKATKDTTFVATFKKHTCTIKVKSVGNGIGELVVNGTKINISELYLGRTLTYEIGTEINIAINPHPNSYFVNHIKGKNSFTLEGNDEVIIFLCKKSLYLEPVFSFIPQCTVKSEV